MNKLLTNKNSKEFDGEIDLQEIFYVLLDGKWMIISLTFFISLIGLVYSLLLPNIYESKALLVPVNSASTISGSVGNYTNLVGLAGISLPPGTDEGNSKKALEKIKSLSLFQDSIIPNIYLPNLMAIESWDPKTNLLAYDEKIYDSISNTWIRDYSYPMQQIPSAQESFKVFESKLTLSEDIKTGFVTLSIKHQSPYVAKQWVELVVNEVNSFYRKKDKFESEKAVSYLNEQISMTGLSEIKQVLAQLLQDETKKLTLIEANEFYVFDYIDPPAVMELKSEPKRSLICILSALFGGIISVLVVLIRRYFFSKKLHNF